MYATVNQGDYAVTGYDNDDYGGERQQRQPRMATMVTAMGNEVDDDGNGTTGIDNDGNNGDDGDGDGAMGSGATG